MKEEKDITTVSALSESPCSGENGDETQKNLCYRCKHIDKFYVKEIKRYVPFGMGWCSVRQETVDIHDGCEKFCLRQLNRKNKKLIYNALNSILTDLSAIRQIIEEEQKENENV